MQELILQNQIVFWVTLGLITINIALFAWLLVWRLKLKALLKGKKGQDLEKIITQQERDLARLKDKLERIIKEVGVIEKHAFDSIQKVGMVRFNPFKEASSNQSFSIAFLNHRENGIVLSSLASREGTRLYTKQIVGGRSIHNLSEEESKAIKEALKKKPDKLKT